MTHLPIPAEDGGDDKKKSQHAEETPGPVGGDYEKPDELNIPHDKPSVEENVT
jgi:hypothetical protein